MHSLVDVVIRVTLFVVRLFARLVTEKKLKQTTVYLLNGFAIWIACICNKK